VALVVVGPYVEEGGLVWEAYQVLEKQVALLALVVVLAASVQEVDFEVESFEEEEVESVLFGSLVEVVGSSVAAEVVLVFVVV